MAGIRETLELGDKFSQTFKNFDAAANASITVAEEFQRALLEFSQGYLDGLVEELQSSRNELESMASEIDNASTSEENFGNEIKNAKDEIKKAEKTQSDFTKEVQNTEKSAKSLYGALSKVATTIGVASLVKSFISTSDEMTQITAKLNLINDGTRTTAALQDAIFNSAQRARGSYLDTANLVARLGMNAKDAFLSNKEMLQFAENLNKSFKIAGASTQEQASVILQMSQALASGVLRGQEFNAVMSGAPNVMRNVAEYMGVSVGALRDMAAEGEITAEIVKNALLSATETINYQFEQIPLTFGDVMTTAKNKITFALSDAFSEWTSTLNEEEFQNKIDKITETITDFAKAGAGAIDTIAEHIDTIVPALEGAGAAVLTFKGLNLLAAQDVGAAWAAAFSEISPLVTAGSIGLAWFLGQKTKQGYEEVNESTREKAKERGFDTLADYLRHLNISLTSGGRTSSGTGGHYGGTTTDLAKRVLDPIEEAARVADMSAWYQSMYDGTRASAEKALQDQEKLYEMYKQEYALNHPAEVINKEDPVPVKVVNEVKLSDEDLRIFRDIAENKYVANVELQTLAPQIAVNIENATGATPDELADVLIAKIEEEMNERTAISH